MKRTLTLLLFLFILTLKAQPPGWTYNQPVSVNNPNTIAAVNYQLRIVVNTQNLISLGRLNTNGSDFRFGGTCTGTSFFNYWIEGPMNATNTVIWVKIPFIAASSSTLIYMFYGNPSATPASSIPGTFRGPNSATDSVSGGTSGGLLVCQRGFRFQPNQNLLVTDFGKNEPSGTLRYVTLFNYTSQAILSQTQVAGPAATYSYGPISSPLWLTAGTQYVLQMFGLATDGYYYQTSSQIGSHLTYIDMQYSNGGSQNTFPNSTLSNYHYGYGDFLYYICSTLAITPTYSLGGGTLNITAPSTAICAGTPITLTTNAAGTFSWNNGATTNTLGVSPLVTTTYSVAETNTTGCNSIAVITITVNSGPPVISVTQNTNTICPTNTVVFTASGAITYTWSGPTTVTNGVAFSPPATGVYTVTGTNGCGNGSGTATINVTPLPVMAIVTPTLICAGSAATLQGAGAANYTWMPGNYTGASPVVTAQGPQIFTVVGTTSVCAGTSTVALAVDPLPTITPSGNTFTICEGNTLTLTANGATSYTWMPGNLTGSAVVVSPPTNTLYTIIGVNSFNCSSNASQVVIVNQAPPVTLGTNRAQVCLGNSATLTANGGGPYTWSTPGSGSVVVVTPNASTVYSVTATNANNGCSKTSTVSVGVFTVPLTVSPATNVCQGGTVTINASGANNYTWTNGPTSAFYAVSPATSTVYTVSAITITLGMNCAVSGSVQVNVNALPSVTAAPNKAQICKNEIATFTAGGAQTYTWNTLVSNPTFTLKATASGYTFNVTGTDANGCANTATAVLKVNNCTGLEEQGMTVGLQIFPNPASGEFSVKSGRPITLQLLNQLGQLEREISLQAGIPAQVNVSGLAKGVYFLVNSEYNIREKISLN